MTPLRLLCLATVGALGLTLATPPSARAWHISGQVFCDKNGNQGFDELDTPLDGVGVRITALTAAPGTTFETTTGSGVGFYNVPLPDHDEDYRVELTDEGVPIGATIVVPSSGAYGVPPVAAVHLVQPAGIADGVNFLLAGCDNPSPTPTASPTATETSTSTATPTITATATSTETPTATTTSPTTTPTPAPSITQTPAPVETPEVFHSHYQCYEVDRSSIGPMTGVSVVDRFGAATIDLAATTVLKRLCNPANVGGDTAPTDPNHLAGYVITGRTPRFTPVKNQVVVNELGTTTVNVVRPLLLMVPSAKSLEGAPAPLAPPTIDHFQCYVVRNARARVSNITVVDQFGSLTLDIKRPSRLCTAVDKRGEGILDPAANLMCYEVRASPGAQHFHGPSGPVYIANQFGNDTLKVTRPTELCFPSILNPDEP